VSPTPGLSVSLIETLSMPSPTLVSIVPLLFPMSIASTPSLPIPGRSNAAPVDELLNFAEAR
jgi:hypothetical protein